MQLYPRWKVNLIVRLEEFGEEGDLIRYARARKVINDLKGGEPRAPLKAIVDPAGMAQGVRRWLISSSDAPPGLDFSKTPNIHFLQVEAAREYLSTQQTSGPIERVFPDDEFEFEIPGIIPFDVTLGLNGFRQSDTLGFKVRFADFPLDPRLLRSVAVKFYLGTVTAKQSADGLTSGDVSQILVPETWQDSQGRTRSNLRFKGWADQIKLNWPDGNDEPFVEFTCRDNTSLLIEQEFPPQYASPALDTNPIDQAIAIMLTNFPQMEGLTVEYRPHDAKPPSLKDALHATAHMPNLGPTPHLAGGAGVGGGASSSKLTVWDYITDMCGAIGHVARLENDTIIIQAVRTATSKNYPQRADDPYTPTTADVDGSQQTFPNRTLIYGRDIQEVSIGRNYTKPGVTNVEVRCYNPKSAKKVMVARYPETKQEQQSSSAAGRHVDFRGAAEVKWTVIRVSGISDETKLRALAQAYYENMGRQEIAISAKTQDLASFGGDGADPDLLDVKAGDTITILHHKTGTSDVSQSFAEIEEAMFIKARAVKFLTTLGFSDKFAERYSDQFRKAGFQNQFRVKTVGIACTEDEGVSVELDLMNYIEVRADRVSDQLSPDDPAQKDGGRTPKGGKGGTPNLERSFPGDGVPAIPKPKSTPTSQLAGAGDTAQKAGMPSSIKSLSQLQSAYSAGKVSDSNYVSSAASYGSGINFFGLGK